MFICYGLCEKCSIQNNKLLDFQNFFPLKMIVMNLLIMNLARNKLQQQSSIVMDSYKVQTIESIFYF